MTKSTLRLNRLSNQQISGTTFKTPEAIVSFFCGMQAQDYNQAKWAIGLRLPGSTDADIEKAIERRKIVRTWAMRGTMQFVAAKDYRWIHDLLSPRYRSVNTSRNRQLGLDEKTLRHSNHLIINALKKQGSLTRNEIAALLNEAGIKTDQNRLSHLLHFATMNGLICFGPRKGKEFSFVLLDDWIPSRRTMPREKALLEMTRRYFISRGPATIKDYVWWSGLSASDAKRGLELAQSELREEILNGQTYWMSKLSTPVHRSKKNTYLLAAFDEYLISYADRSFCLTSATEGKTIYVNGIFHPIIVIDGTVAGIWRPVMKNKSVAMRSELFMNLTKSQLDNVKKEFMRYQIFAGILT